MQRVGRTFRIRVIRGCPVPPKIAAAAEAARRARKEMGRTSYWRLIAAYHLTA